MTAPFRTKRRVEFRDTDAAGIAHFSMFFIYMEQAEHEMLRSVGLSVLETDGTRMVSWPRVSARCDYQSPVRFEDVLDVELVIARLGGKSVTYSFNFSHQGRAIAAGEISAVCCTRSPEGVWSGVPIPDSIRARLADLR